MCKVTPKHSKLTKQLSFKTNSTKHIKLSLFREYFIFTGVFWDVIPIQQKSIHFKEVRGKCIPFQPFNCILFQNTKRHNFSQKCLPNVFGCSNAVLNYHAKNTSLLPKKSVMNEQIHAHKLRLFSLHIFIIATGHSVW